MINYFAGPEGAGKTALMTYYCREHHLKGGEVWAFPGYELKNLRGRVVSKMILPHEVMGKIDELHGKFLVIDEIQVFMNHHYWQNQLVDILTYGALAQRRKRQFVLMATGPFFRELPPGLRNMFHIVYNCQDKHWKNHDIPRGQKIKFTMTDMRGILSGRPYSSTRPKVFRPADYFRYYDTFSLTDPKYLSVRMKIVKEEMRVDAEGNIIEPKKDLTATLALNIEEFLEKNNNPDEFEKASLYSYIRHSIGKLLDNAEMIAIGRIMPQLGYKSIKKGQVFALTD